MSICSLCFLITPSNLFFTKRKMIFLHHNHVSLQYKTLQWLPSHLEWIWHSLTRPWGSLPSPCPSSTPPLLTGLLLGPLWDQVLCSQGLCFNVLGRLSPIFTWLVPSEPLGFKWKLRGASRDHSNCTGPSAILGCSLYFMHSSSPNLQCWHLFSVHLFLPVFLVRAKTTSLHVAATFPVFSTMLGTWQILNKNKLTGWMKGVLPHPTSTHQCWQRISDEGKERQPYIDINEL